MAERRPLVTFGGDVQEMPSGDTVPLTTLDATLTALAGLATGANQVPYSTGADTFSQAALTAYARTLLDDANAATARQTLGVRIANPPLQAGQYYFTASPGYVTTLGGSGVGSLRLAPWVLDAPVSLVRIGAEVTTAGEVGAKLRLAIYSDDGTGEPGTVILDSGQVAADAVGSVEVVISVTLPAGILWIGAVIQNVTTTQPGLRAISNWTPPVPIKAGPTVPAAGATAVGRLSTGQTGALSSPLSGLAPAGLAPRIFVKVA